MNERDWEKNITMDVAYHSGGVGAMVRAAGGDGVLRGDVQGAERVDGADVGAGG